MYGNLPGLDLRVRFLTNTRNSRNTESDLIQSPREKLARLPIEGNDSVVSQQSSQKQLFSQCGPMRLGHSCAIEADYIATEWPRYQTKGVRTAERKLAYKLLGALFRSL
jgi:hypothetical protein